MVSRSILNAGCSLVLEAFGGLGGFGGGLVCDILLLVWPEPRSLRRGELELVDGGAEDTENGDGVGTECRNSDCFALIRTR